MQALQDVVGNFFFAPVTAAAPRISIAPPIPNLVLSSPNHDPSLESADLARSEIYTSSRVRSFPLLPLGWASGGHNLQEEREKVRELPLHPRRERNVSGGRVGWRRRFVALRERERGIGTGSEGVSCSDWNWESGDGMR